MTFAAWVRFREPEFFATAPMLSGGGPLLARRAYEERLAAYGRAWASHPSIEQHGRQEPSNQ
jgi:hypothetical protein